MVLFLSRDPGTGPAVDRAGWNVEDVVSVGAVAAAVVEAVAGDAVEAAVVGAGGAKRDAGATVDVVATEAGPVEDDVA